MYHFYMHSKEALASPSEFATKEDLGLIKSEILEHMDRAIEGLAIMVKHGFDDTQAQINSLSGEIKEVKVRLDRIEWHHTLFT